MRILFLALDIVLDNQRGDAVHTGELCRSLAARGNQLDLVTATPRSRVPEFGPRVHHHTRPNGGDLSILRFCTRVADEASVDAIYERRLAPKIGYGVSQLTKKPFVVEVNGSEEELTVQGRSLQCNPVKRWARSWMYRRAFAVVAVTPQLANEVRERHRLTEDRVVVISNGVNPTRFAPMDSLEARRRLGLARDKLILFVGNLAPWQGLETLVDSMTRVTEVHPSAQLVIVGDGLLRDSLAARASTSRLTGKVVFAGQVANDLVPLYINAASVCVVTSSNQLNARVGRSPLKLYEYLACARPVVASAVPGVVEVVTASDSGILVPPDDPAALAGAINALLDNPEIAATRGESGRRYIEVECTWDRTAQRVEAVLGSAVDRTDPGGSIGGD